MEPESLSRLRSLLTESRVVALALVVDDAPVAGLLPFLASNDLGALHVHVSTLARHTRGLDPGARFSAAVSEPDRAELDALRIPRLLVEGVVEEVGEAELVDLRERWAARFPSAAMTLGLGDFTFRRLRLGVGRLITGFARTEPVGPTELAAAAASGR